MEYNYLGFISSLTVIALLKPKAKLFLAVDIGDYCKIIDVATTFISFITNLVHVLRVVLQR